MPPKSFGLGWSLRVLFRGFHLVLFGSWCMKCCAVDRDKYVPHSPSSSRPFRNGARPRASFFHVVVKSSLRVTANPRGLNPTFSLGTFW